MGLIIGWYTNQLSYILQENARFCRGIKNTHVKVDRRDFSRELRVYKKAFKIAKKHYERPWETDDFKARSESFSLNEN